ncbi:MAG TPA: RCC1 repeat-containing protein, partial [Polyangia bacterium]
WGANKFGQLGQGTIENPLNAMPSTSDVLSGVQAVAAGSEHTCALMKTGGVRCWGANGVGELGDGILSDRSIPPADDVLGGVQAIAASYLHTCVLMATGGVRCWGGNDEGELGDGTTTNRSIPPTSDVLGGVQAIATGREHTCALTATGGVRCWGGDTEGELGVGSLNFSPTATPPTSDVLGGVQAIAACGHYTCALMKTGGVRCWGDNDYGQLGNGTRLQYVASPPTSDVLSGVQAVATGFAHTCALMTTGGVRCWGYNQFGQLGDGTTTDRWTPPTNDVLSGVQAIAAGYYHTCAVMTTGGVRCWGRNEYGQLGIPLPNHSTPAPVLGICH